MTPSWRDELVVVVGLVPSLPTDHGELARGTEPRIDRA